MITLNPQQRKAVEHSSSPLLIVAGAGTGKTTVITERIRWLIQEKKVKPEEILALTFTEKAAEEMLGRIDTVMPLGYEEPWLSTFHAWADRLLRTEALEIGLDPAYTILTSSAQWLFFRQHLFDFDLKYYRPLGNPTKFITAILTLFSRIQDEDLTLEDLDKFIEKLRDSPLKRTIPNFNLEKERWEEVFRAYTKYQELKIAESKLDFGDLMAWLLRLFRERPNVLARYQTQFKHILVDEFQDTNYAQYQLIKLLAPAKSNPNLVVVGDDSQSIYRFRGAALSNILEFRADYPQAEIVILNSNYRSGQEILDSATKLIRHNEPDTLEVKLGLDKSLKSQRTAMGRDARFCVSTLSVETGEKEAELVVSKILEIRDSPHIRTIPNFSYSDFAILARANAHLDPFVAALRRAGVPYQLLGNRGLFGQEEIILITSLLKVLADPTDSVSLYHVLSRDAKSCVSTVETQPNHIRPTTPGNVAGLASLLQRSYKNRQPLWEVLPDTNSLKQTLIKFRELAVSQPVTRVLYDLLMELKILNPWLEEESIENQLKIKNVELFYNKAKQFEASSDNPIVIEFVEYLDLLLEAGEDPAQAEIEDVDTVKLLTVHAAKGLEWPVVFLVNLVAGRFPTRNRKDPIPLPDQLVKERLPEGNAHLQEERRLFYVGMTRARDQLFLTYADNYGGKRQTKLSGYVGELGDVISNSCRDAACYVSTGVSGGDDPPRADYPRNYSYSQLETFDQCPLKYKYKYILRVPGQPGHALSFGQTIHRTLRDFHAAVSFSNAASEKPLQFLLDLYKKHWIGEGYQSVAHRQKQFEEGELMLKRYFTAYPTVFGKPLFLEKKIKLVLDPHILVGSIDRWDQLSTGGYEIIDYKTGSAAKGEKIDKNQQLAIYGLAAWQETGNLPEKLSLYFLETNEKFSTSKTGEELTAQKTAVLATIKKIAASDFSPTPGFLCQYCEYRRICSKQLTTK